jgi:hypothetical protein
MNTKAQPIKKIIREKVVSAEEEPTEKFLLALPNGITCMIESSQKSIEELASLGVGSVNSVLQFNSELNSKIKRSYLG